MRISIIGTGGVGGYFGGRLAEAGNEVTFFARGEHLQAIQHNGLKVKSTKGDFHIHPSIATDNIAEINNPELVLVCTKAWQVKEIAEQLVPVVNESTVVLPLQNGILAAEELCKYLPKVNVIGGLCRVFSKIESPGVINHMGLEPTIIFGERNKTVTERILGIKKIFDDAGITNIASEDIEAETWKKFLMICSSGLGAVARSTYGELLENEGTRQMMKELFGEIYNVGRAAGVNLPEDIVDKTMAAVEGFGYSTMSSLTRDVIDCKHSEIEYQNGTVVKLAKKYNIDVPVNSFIYNCILPMEKRAVKK